MGKKEVYFNSLQIRFVTAVQKIRVLLAGRGVGKSTLIAWVIYEMLRAMGANQKRKAAKIFFASTTLEQIKNSMLPPITKKWEEMGLMQDVHYVIDKSPPDWFDEPYSKPEDYSNSITFWNGFTIMLLSTTRPNGKRGGSYDAGIVDEAAFMHGRFRSAFFPMIRDNLYKFSTHWHHALILLSSRPRTTTGYWIYDLKNKAEAEPDKVLWMEGSAIENKEVLGEEWFDNQRQILGDDYEVEVENKEITHLPTGFYHNLDKDRHYYTPRPGEVDIRHDEILEVSFDFGGKFNCASVWQEHNNVERCVQQFYVKRGGKIEALVNGICKHYRTHGIRYVRVWGDPRGHDADPGRPSLYEIIQQQFQANEWAAEIRVLPGKRTTAHKARYEFMESLLGGSNLMLPQVLFNRSTCADLIKALEICDVRDDYQKVKEMEKDPNFPQEHAPHFTDTVDYYLYEKHAWRLMPGSSRAGQVYG